MLSRLIAGLLLKAVLSLAVLLGIASYGHYLSGGDPGALWRRVAGHAFDGAAGSIEELRERIGSPVATLADAAGTAGSRETGLTSVWTWQDENGITHYANLPPTDIDAVVIDVDPDTNVLAPVAVPAAGRSKADAVRGETRAKHGRMRADAGGADPGSATGEPLPGIGGALSRARGESAGADPEKAAALLRMLQGATR